MVAERNGGRKIGKSGSWRKKSSQGREEMKRPGELYDSQKSSGLKHGSPTQWK